MNLVTVALTLTTVTIGSVAAALWQRAAALGRRATAFQTLAHVVVEFVPALRSTSFLDLFDGPFGMPRLRHDASFVERCLYGARMLAWNVVRRVVSFADWIRRQCHKAWIVLIVPLSPLAHAQASPFSVGAAAVQNNFLVIFTPIAVVSVMAVAIAFWFNRLSAAWAIGWVIGIVLFFGAPQMVAWVRAMFGV